MADLGRLSRRIRDLPRALVRERRLLRTLRRAESPPSDPRSVSLIVLTRDGRERLERLLPALRRRTDHAAVELVVFDNGSQAPTRSYLAAQPQVRVLRSEENRSYAAANNAAARQSTGEVLCFLNDDVEPLAQGWLPRMLAALQGDVVAVGAQLVHPRPRARRAGQPALRVQHLGIAFEPVPDGVPRAVHLGRGAWPRPDARPVEVAAATAACLLVRRADFERIGGFDEGYVYGAEDVDLCWRLRQGGGRVVVVPAAVALHDAGATRRTTEASARARREAGNWERFVRLHGPAVRRAVAEDRLDGRRVLSSRALQVGVVGEPSGGVAGAVDVRHALTRLGWESHAIRAPLHAGAPWPDVLDVLLVLDPGVDPGASRPGLTTVAVVSARPEQWASASWYGRFSEVLAVGPPVATLVRPGCRPPVAVAVPDGHTAPATVLAEAVRDLLRRRLPPPPSAGTEQAVQRS